jgi:hypothetical protein
MGGNKQSGIWYHLVSSWIALTFVSGVRHDLKSPLLGTVSGCFPQSLCDPAWDRKGDSVPKHRAILSVKLFKINDLQLSHGDPFRANQGREDPRFAARVERMLACLPRKREHKQFLSAHPMKTRWSDRFKNTEKCLFPEKVFGRFNRNDRLAVLGTTGAMHTFSRCGRSYRASHRGLPARAANQSSTKIDCS